MYLEILKSIQAKSSYLISKQTKRKVDESGCWNYLLRQVKPIAETSAINFWRQDNHPKELITENFTRQKLDYIHHNPVEAGIVEKAEEYLYSSAKDYLTNRKGLLEIKFLF
jgi:REP element-mobilizing transposase RayT